MKNKDIKPGDKVRFLNDVGGGEVTRIDGKTIYVIDEIGFEVPVPVSEVVVVERKNENVSEKSGDSILTPNEDNAINTSHSEAIEDESPYIDPHHDDLNPRIYLAFTSENINSGDQKVDFYMVNDSNYFCYYLIAETGDDGLARGLFSGTLQPNTKEFLEQFSTTKMDVSWHVQLILHRKDKPSRLFDPVNELVKIKAYRFYRDNAYKDNDFFDYKAVLIPVIKSEFERRLENLSKKKTQRIIKEKEASNEKKITAKKQNRPEIIEVDLHIHELLDNTSGLTSAEILKIQLDKFHAVMEEHQKLKGQKIVFIHGIGNGTLKHEVRRQLNTRYKKHSFQDASFREYGYGATLVII
ncbi:DUF2027 domain-containing protein [Thermophagus sp. OGC60D27]|uniref:DUF2027 domain-containing protein n=1 Tax=Thermophagus sp. OGC60D27 TaxID=3458415 RepID=UPI004037FE3F